MPKSDHREPIKFVGMYFIDEHGEDYRTGQIIAQISDGYYLAQFEGEIAPETTGHGLPLRKCEAYNRVYDQPYESR
jgi:hypothetical protein